jgi:hypothetical protein
MATPWFLRPVARGHSTVNRKVVGSIPTGTAPYLNFSLKYLNRGMSSQRRNSLSCRNLKKELGAWKPNSSSFRPNTSRKKPRAVIVDEQPKQKPFDNKWSTFLKEGEILFDYMIKKYNIMITDDRIKNLEIFGIHGQFYSESRYLEKNHLVEIKKELLPWIQQQYESGQLFEKSNWKPFRNFTDFLTSTFGYRVMFQYKEFYFQLTLDSYYPFDVGLKDDEYNEYDWVCFNLALYGWKEDDKEKLQPDGMIIPPDNIMPESYWELK